MQYTNEKKVEELTLKIYAGSNIDNPLYEDAGEGYDYSNGDYSLRKFTTTLGKSKFKLNQSVEGKRVSDYSSIKIEIYGLPSKIKSCKLDNKSMSIKADKSSLKLSIKPNFSLLEIEF